jgi:hypothetical protein
MATWQRILTTADLGDGSVTDTSLATHNQNLSGNRIIGAQNSTNLTIKGDSGSLDSLSPLIARFSAVNGDSTSVTELFGSVQIRPFQSGGNTFNQGALSIYEAGSNGENFISVFAPTSLSSSHSFALPIGPPDLNNKGYFLTLEDSSGELYTSKWVWKTIIDTPEIEGGAGEPAGSVVGSADPDKFYMLVHDADSDSLKHMDIQELYGAITTSLFQALIDSGYGSTEAYTGTSGLLGDINNDGQVSTGDLLEFLTQFGQVETASPTTVTITSTPPTSGPFDLGQVLDIGAGDAAVNSGDFATTVNVAQDWFTIEEGLNNALTQYPNKTIVVEPASGYTNNALFVQVNTIVVESVTFSIRVQSYNDAGEELSDEEYILHTFNTTGTPGDNYYGFPLVSIPGDQLGINGPNSPAGTGVASIKVRFLIKDEAGWVGSAGINGIKFSLTVTP